MDFLFKHLHWFLSGIYRRNQDQFSPFQCLSSYTFRVMPVKTDYHLKYKEVNRCQHKRALALTVRKFVRLVFRLLKDNRLYCPAK